MIKSGTGIILMVIKRVNIFRSLLIKKKLLLIRVGEALDI